MALQRAANGKKTSLKLLSPTSKKQRLARIFAIFVATVALCYFLDLQASRINFLERYADTLRLKVYAQRNGTFDQWAKENIIVVARTDDSFSELQGGRIPRSYHAKVVRDLTRAGAKVIAFDYLFSSTTPYDKEFAAAAKAGPVIWGAAKVEANPETNTPTQLVLPNKQLLEACPYYGHLTAPLDADNGQVTRIPATVMGDKNLIPSLSLEVARFAHNQENQPLLRTPTAIKSGSLSIPISSDGSFRIKYFGSQPSQVFQTIPYEVIYEGAVDTPFYKDFFRNKIVLIGDTTSAANDHRTTPLGDMEGVEIHAHAIATLMEGSLFREMPSWVNLAFIAAVTTLVCPFVALLRSGWAALWTFFLLFGTVFFNFWLFVDYEISTHLVTPMAALMISTLGILVERSLSVERDKFRAQALLQRYVSPQIANYVLANPDKCLLGGVRVTGTVLFSDIRGFTALSENLTPEDVLLRLNEYFEAMTQVVFKHDGTVDKYIGDAIMAIFGAPVPHPDHARRAVSTALDMEAALLELQERWREQGLPVIDIGIGINTGDMVFGNMGAKDRMDFSVLGDAVNLASRVESLNKEMGSRVLITDSTYEAVKDEIEVRGPLTTHVKGKVEEVVVYEVLKWKSQVVASSPPPPKAKQRMW